MMPVHKDRIQETISSLKQQRDELALQIHLGAIEVKQEYADTLEKLDQLTEEFEPLKKAATESADNILSSLELTSEEISNSFTRIRQSLK